MQDSDRVPDSFGDRVDNVLRKIKMLDDDDDDDALNQNNLLRNTQPRIAYALHKASLQSAAFWMSEEMEDTDDGDGIHVFGDTARSYGNLISMSSDEELENFLYADDGAGGDAALQINRLLSSSIEYKAPQVPLNSGFRTTVKGDERSHSEWRRQATQDVHSVVAAEPLDPGDIDEGGSGIKTFKDKLRFYAHYLDALNNHINYEQWLEKHEATAAAEAGGGSKKSRTRTINKPKRKSRRLRKKPNRKTKSRKPKRKTKANKRRKRTRTRRR